jgi:SSS family solute:Na+ symporter
VSTVSLQGVSYRTSTVFTVAGLGVILILAGLYARFW